jgi:hypothetical protein
MEYAEKKLHFFVVTVDRTVRTLAKKRMAKEGLRYQQNKSSAHPSGIE